MLYDRTDVFSIVTVDQNTEFDMLSGGIESYQPIIQGYLTVPQSAEGRLDLISNEVYSTPTYWWLIALANNITDIEAQVISGVSLAIPSISSWYAFYNQNVKVSSNTSVNESGVSVLE